MALLSWCLMRFRGFLEAMSWARACMVPGQVHEEITGREDCKHVTALFMLTAAHCPQRPGVLATAVPPLRGGEEERTEFGVGPGLCLPLRSSIAFLHLHVSPAGERKCD